MALPPHVDNEKKIHFGTLCVRGSGVVRYPNYNKEAQDIVSGVSFVLPQIQKIIINISIIQVCVKPPLRYAFVDYRLSMFVCVYAVVWDFNRKFRNSEMINFASR